ncbi:hypothetical protein GCM10022198_12360 [Klugiella xanthotipulae]|uniref:DUF1684 domain-containing protein n=1 Tax=Klugiella xanthotipulae TaxID=244735 RepID=A0A543I405_9MICO|nr:DUF1684 domain-containing protein [Klugiella xanthotipulae]TQM65323.1 hypothetical protein FB466_0118 [Klugiella xanthotipulae]
MPHITSQSDLNAPVDVVNRAYESFASWRADRDAAVTAPTGNLALVETRWLPAAGPRASEIADEQPPGVRVSDVKRIDPDTGETEVGLRFWDADSAAIRSFETIDAFPFAPEWVVTAHFTPVDAERTVPFEHIRDNGGTRDLVVPGDISVTLGGEKYTLSAFDDNGTLLLVFGDLTNRSQEPPDATYPAGRFLHIPTELDRGETGTVVLDFNRAFIPPCGFSPHYNCPLPPAQNRINLAVTAGEKSVLTSA